MALPQAQLLRWKSVLPSEVQVCGAHVRDSGNVVSVRISSICCVHSHSSLVVMSSSTCKTGQTGSTLPLCNMAKVPDRVHNHIYSLPPPSPLPSLPSDPYSVRMHALVCLTTDYPTTPPAFAVCIQTSSKKKEPHDIHVKVT